MSDGGIGETTLGLVAIALGFLGLVIVFTILGILGLLPWLAIFSGVFLIAFCVQRVRIRNQKEA